MVFRSASTTCPQPRGRIAFELARTALLGVRPWRCRRPRGGTGSWSLEGDMITLSDGAAQGVPREMEVVAVDDERLVIRKRHDGS